MFHIQQPQYEQLRQATAGQFVERVLSHVQQHFPNHWRVVGRPALAQLVGLARSRAAAHGFERQREVGQYVNLMLLLGAGFDRDPLLPWAGSTLQQRRTERSARLDRLYDRALQFLDASAGRRNEHLEAALRRVLAQARSGWMPAPAANFGPYVSTLLHWVFPQRAQACGTDALQACAAQAARDAVALGLRGQTEALLYIGLAYMLGSGFATDPQFPWACQALVPLPGDGPGAGHARLKAAALQTLSRWLSEG